jgi:hypothetical protein
MMTGQQGIPYTQTLDAAAELAGRLRLVLGDDDAAAAVEVIVAAGWRPAPPDGPIGDLVTEEDITLSYRAGQKAVNEDGEHPAFMRAALESYGPRLLARHGRGGDG